MSGNDLSAIAPSKDCDRQNSSNLAETAIALHVLKQNQVIAVSKYFMASMIWGMLAHLHPHLSDAYQLGSIHLQKSDRYATDRR
jgi:hypothetical protein